MNADTRIADPSIIKRNKTNCWKVFSVERLTVFKPASVMADTARNKASINARLLGGVEEPHSMIPDTRHTARKYV